MSFNFSPIAFLFPGQGSESVRAWARQKLAALYLVVRETFDEADEALDYKLSQLCFEGPEDQLKLTEMHQPAILTGVSRGISRVQSKGITPAYVAGHSLGENSAHVAAGTLSFVDAVPHSSQSGQSKYMQGPSPSGWARWPPFLPCPPSKVHQVRREAAQSEVCQA